MGTVESLCVGNEKGKPKTPVESATFIARHGIESDAHAGPWHRQVSLLSAEDIDGFRKRTAVPVSPGDFAENIIVSGLSLPSLGLGSRIALGDQVVLSITQIGKTCHAPCRIGQAAGECILPRVGLFARVLEGGQVHAGQAAAIRAQVPRTAFQVVVLTISDRCSRNEAVDTAGPAVVQSLAQSLEAHVYRTEILPDERDQIAARLRHYCDGHSIDLVVTVGGTGFSPRDVSPEATRDVVQRFTPGLDEAMRAASLAKTPRALLSRGVSGIRNSTLIINLPGSLRAAAENLEVILPGLEHGLRKLRGDPEDCGRAPEARS